ncbi:7314_t:CDS:2, partial [Ambispora gerdemannii]
MESAWIELKSRGKNKSASSNQTTKPDARTIGAIKAWIELKSRGKNKSASSNNNINEEVSDDNSEHITAVSIVNQVIEEEPWFPKEDSRQIIYNAIASIKNLYGENSE